MKKLLLSLLGALIALPTMAYEIEYTYEGHTLTYYIDEYDKTCMTAMGEWRGDPGNLVSGDLILPATVSDGKNEYTLTIIGVYSFYGCTDLKSVTIPNTVIGIGASAFADCTSLTSVTMSNAVTEICDNTFYGCKSLTSITIPDLATKIGTNAFCGCSSLTSISIGDSVTEIGGGSFDGCTSLTSVTIGNSVTEIGRYAFNGCNSLSSVTIPNSVTKIGYGTFKGCSSLISFNIPNSVIEIGSGAFSGCSGLPAINVESDNEYFSSDNGVLLNKDKTQLIVCPGGKSGEYTIPNSVTEINSNAFSGCINLTAINVEIGNEYFSSENGVLFNKDKTELIVCPGGKSGDYTIPVSVTSMYLHAFTGCNNLTAINVEKSHDLYSSENGVLFNKDKTELIIYPGGKSGDYTIPNAVTTIGINAFQDCHNLTSITIPSSVTRIGSSAFEGCTGLTSVTIPNSVTIIISSTFSGCTGLTELTLPNTITWIKINAFLGCTSLTSVTIPNSVTLIGGSAFGDCSNLTSVTISSSVTEIDSNAFGNCNSIKSVTYLAEQPMECHKYAFDNVVYKNATLNYLATAEEKIATTEPWSLFKNRIGRDADFKDDSAILEVRTSNDGPSAVYNLRGIRVGESTEGLPHGIYIVKSPGKTTKVAL